MIKHKSTIPFPLDKVSSQDILEAIAQLEVKQPTDNNK
jgi:hypothetical protein